MLRSHASPPWQPPPPPPPPPHPPRILPVPALACKDQNLGLGFRVPAASSAPPPPAATCCSWFRVQIEEHLLQRNVKRFRGGLVFKAHRLVYHTTLGLRVIKKKKFGVSPHAPCQSPRACRQKSTAPSLWELTFADDSPERSQRKVPPPAVWRCGTFYQLLRDAET